MEKFHLPRKIHRHGAKNALAWSGSYTGMESGMHWHEIRVTKCNRKMDFIRSRHSDKCVLIIFIALFDFKMIVIIFACVKKHP